MKPENCEIGEWVAWHWGEIMQHATLETWVMQQPTPWHKLAAAIVVKALKDAKDGDPDARRWVASDGLPWFDYLGLDGGIVAYQVQSLQDKVA